MSTSADPRPRDRAPGLRVPGMAVMAVYGFMAGLPFPLSAFTLRYWLSESGATATLIGATATIGLAYSLKFLWSPVMDQARPPGPAARLGQRRGWLVVIQSGLVLATVSVALSSPASAAAVTIGAAALVAFLSASQDIAIDAWRIETFPQRQQGTALAVYVWAYRFALLTAQSGAIWGAGRIGWHGALLAVASLMCLGPVVTLLVAEEPERPAEQPQKRVESRLAHAFLDPLRDFLTRPGAWLILSFVALFKLGEAMAGIMTAPFYRALEFSRDAIAGAGPFSLVATLTGIMAGGWLVARIGVRRALLWTGVGQTVAMVMYEVLAHAPGEIPVLYATVSVEAFAQGMADAAFLTFLSGLCSRAFTATHYALLSSIPMLAIHTIGATSGGMAQALGWPGFYAACIFAALPAMGMMVVLLRVHPFGDEEPDRPHQRGCNA